MAGIKRELVTVVDGWVQCPICKRNRRLLRVSEDTRAERLLAYCRSCKNEMTLDIKGIKVERLTG